MFEYPASVLRFENVSYAPQVVRGIPRVPIIWGIDDYLKPYGIAQYSEVRVIRRFLRSGQQADHSFTMRVSPSQ